MLTIAICDDNSDQIAALTAAVERALPNKEYKMRTFCCPPALLDARKSGEPIDILFLDICMPEQDGVSVARELNRVSPQTQIIYVSAYDSYATDVYETEHLYFLKKPISPEKLQAALARALERIARARDIRVAFAGKGGGQRILRLSEILYFERQNHVTHVVLCDGGFDTMHKLFDIEPLFPEDTFARPHNSYLVNLAYVRATARTSLRIEGGAEIPISNQKRAAFLQALARSF